MTGNTDGADTDVGWRTADGGLRTEKKIFSNAFLVVIVLHEIKNSFCAFS